MKVKYVNESRRALDIDDYYIEIDALLRSENFRDREIEDILFNQDRTIVSNFVNGYSAEQTAKEIAHNEGFPWDPDDDFDV